MANKPSQKLSQLIHALSPSEKRYFSLFTSKQKDRAKGSLALFRAIASGRDSRAPANSISKSRLYERLLKSLRSFHSEHSPQTDILNLFIDVEILFERNLSQQCQKRLARIEHLVETQKAHHFDPLISIWKSRIAEIDQNNVHAADRVQLKRPDAEYEKEIFLRNLLNQIKSILREKGKALCIEELGVFYKLTDGQFRKLNYEKLDVRNQVIYQVILGEYSYAVNDIGKSQTALKVAKGKIENNPHLFSLDQSIYINVLARLVETCYQQKLRTEASVYFNILLNPNNDLVNRDSIRTISLWKSMVVYCRALNARFARESEKAGLLALSEKHLAQLDHMAFSTALHNASYQIAVGYAELRDFASASRILHRMSAVANHKAHPVLMMFARNLELVCQYEMQNRGLFTSLLRSARRQFKKYNKAEQFTGLLLESLARFQRAHNEEDLIQNLQHFLKKLQQIHHSPYERIVFEFFDYYMWGKTKLQATQNQEDGIAA